MATENLTTSIKYEIWTNLQIKNHELTLIRPQTQHKSPEHFYLKFWKPFIQSVEKIVNLHGFKFTNQEI